MRGFRYLDAGSVATLPVEDVVERVEAIHAAANQPDAIEAAALLGIVPEPRITVSKVLELYWTLARKKTFGKSKDQLRRWEAPRNKAIRNFVSVVGDKEIANIARDDMLDFRQHWLERIEAGEVTANSANKDLIPLIGVSLEAFKEFPEGFPRYRDSATLSATVNKFLRSNGLLETPRHSFYSLRHSFEDRMLAAGIDDRIRRDLFGQRLDRERYGKGASLENVAELVRGIAF